MTTNTTNSSNGGSHASSANGIAGNSPSLLLTTVKWAVENDLFLSDLVQRCSLPHLALVTKGQYLSVGAPNVANPNLKPYLLVHSKHRIRKVLAQVVKVKEGKGQTLTEYKLSIPESYKGYFEILSEDGRPVRCLESVQELFQKFPELCLVRQSCKGIVPDGDGELRSLYRTRVIAEGEVLTLVGQFNFKRVSFLRCFDELGRSVYLKMNQKAKFSPIAKSKDAIVGVHTIQNLMTKRLPLTVKLVHQPQPTQNHCHNGSLPQEVSKLLSGSGGHLVVRLLTTFREDVVFAYAVHKPDGQFLSVPLNAHLKLAPAVNHPQLLTHHEFREICHSCDEVLSTFYDRISICNDHQLVYEQQQYNFNFDHDHNGSEQNETTVAVNGSKHDISCDGKNPIYNECANGERTEANSGDQDPCAALICDDEIDQLYDYIRGLAPMPTTCDQATQQPVAHHPRSKHPAGQHRAAPPPPPPVETIPSRKSTNSFSSPEPKLGQSPPDPHRQRILSLVSPVPAILPAVSTATKVAKGETLERKPSLSPVPPEPRAKSPSTQYVIEVRMRNTSYHNDGIAGGMSRPVSNGHVLIVSDVPPAVPEKRLDDVIYGKHIDRLRRLSKSTEKIPGAAEDYYDSQYPSKGIPNGPSVPLNGHDRAYIASRHHYYQNHNPQQQHRKNGQAAAGIPHQYARRMHSRPRPMSMVIPDSAAVMYASSPAAAPAHDFFPTPYASAGDPYLSAYRSFINLTALDDPPPPPPPPPMYHGQNAMARALRAAAASPPPQQSYYPPMYGANVANRQIYHRYAPRNQYQAAYRV